MNNTTHKYCTWCQKWKTKEKFAYSKQTKDRLYGYCRECSALRSKEYREKNAYRMKHLKEVAYIRSRQKGNNKAIVGRKISCSVTKSKERNHIPCLTDKKIVVERFSEYCQCCGIYVGITIHLDHCHTTGEFRGFICSSCNLLIGHAKNSIEVLENAIQYLKNSKV